MLTTALLAISTAEMILGGPGFWIIEGVSIRRALFVLVTAWLIVLTLLGRIRLRSGHILLLASLVVFVAVWVFMIPLLYDPGQIELAIQEGLPLGFAVPGTLAHAYFTEHPERWSRIRATARYSLAAAAVASIIMWVIGTSVGDEWPLVAVAAHGYFSLGNVDLDLPLYIMQMPDGFFRVMWITSLLFIPGLLMSWARRSKAGMVLFSCALFTTYTRAFWGVALLGLLAAFLLMREAGATSFVRGRHLGAAAAVVLVGALIAATVSDSIDFETVWTTVVERVQTTFSDESAGDRVDQFEPLLAAWESAPVVGRGFGSVASVVRSEQAPYLYELTYVALLMKLGIVGLIVFLGAPALMLTRPLLTGTRLAPGRAGVWASIVSILAASATNPYLLNLVGLGALSYLFIELDLASETVLPAEILEPAPGVLQ